MITPTGMRMFMHIPMHMFIPMPMHMGRRAAATPICRLLSSSSTV